VIVVKGLLLHSLSTQQPLEMIYLSDKGEISQRVIIVEEIQKNKVVAFCKLRNQYRTFKIENILSISIARKKGRKAWAS
jgi:predicted DNA-binding transcriptional regulator YafY